MADVYLVRHAIAEERREGLAEADRELTSKGRRRFESVVDGLARLGVELDAVVHSPWRRAVETAQMLRPLARDGLVAHEGLVTAPATRLLDAIAAAGARVAVVGHDPWLPELLALLATGDPAHGPRFAIKKGGVAHLTGEVRPGHMQLRALFTPRVFRFG